MPANVDGMVREGVSAYRAGRKEEARALLLRAVEIDERNEQAWMWLSAVVDSVEEQRTCLENVLTINPANERARQGLEMLSQKAGPAVTSRAPSPAQDDDLLASASFTGTPTPPSRIHDDDEDDELPSSIEWNTGPVTASSSASSNHKVNEPSSAELDDWVSNLGLGGAATGGIDPASQYSSVSFGTDEDEEEEPEDDLFSLIDRGGDDEDDLFADGPFSANETPMPRTVTPPPVSKPAPAARSATPRVSPSGRSSNLLLDAIDNDAPFDTEFLEEDDADDAELDKMDAADFFQYIPKEIKATRLPGTNERYPAIVMIGLVVVLLVNAGAVALMVMNLTAK